MSVDRDTLKLGPYEVSSFWQLADAAGDVLFASITLEAPEGAAALSVTASVAAIPGGGWRAEWWTTTATFVDVNRADRPYRRREAAVMRAIHALHDELRAISTPVLARAS